MNEENRPSETRFLRQLDIISPKELERPVTIIGVGGIGSPIALALAKMGCSNMTLYDDDMVEEHNLPNQIFREKDIDKPKVQAAKEIIKEFIGLDVTAKNEKYTNQPLSNTVISGVDSMKVRKEIWSKIRGKPQVRLYIDARMGGELARIYAINPCDPDDIEFYEKTLYSDDEAEQLKCTGRSIIYNVFGLASLICVLVKKKEKGEQVPKVMLFDFSKPLLLVRESLGNENLMKGDLKHE